MNAGLQATLYKFFFLRLDNKTVYINLFDILIRGTGYTD